MKPNPRVIVSLTSFPAALYLAHVAIRTILKGSVLPDKIVLYLTASQFPDGKLPAEIETLKQNPVFEVRFVDGENLRSYTKLVPALRDFPDDIIITIDDDESYRRRMVEKLLRLHRKYPDMIIAHNVRCIMTEADGKLKPYFGWKRYKPHLYWKHPPRAGYCNLMFGMAGVLYPPNSLDSAMLDPGIFLTMAPTVDDVWFWAASVAAGTKTYPVPFGYRKPTALGKPPEIALGTINIRSGVDVNRNVVLAILEKYPLIKQRLEESLAK